MMPSWASLSPWVPCTAPLSSGTAYRNAKLLTDIVEQFKVETSARYAPTNGKTYCNIFVWDVTRALGCELPHWWMGTEMTANALTGWLEKLGPQHGWKKSEEIVARTYADEGKPAVVTWLNPSGGPGHIAVLVPAKFSTETEIAQAGLSNFSRGSLSRGFGSKSVTFYVHA